MSEAARTFTDPERIDRRHPSSAPAVVVNPEALTEAIAAGAQTFQGTRDLNNAIAVACVRLLAVLAAATRRGARFPLSNGKAVEVHPADVQVAMLELQHHAGGLLVGVRAEEAVARALDAAYNARERRALLRATKEHRQPAHSRLTASMVDQVGQRVAAPASARTGTMKHAEPLFDRLVLVFAILLSVTAVVAVVVFR